MYDCFQAPLTASKVLQIICSLAWVNTWMVTSSGIILLDQGTQKFLILSQRLPEKPTSISLKPIFTRSLKNSISVQAHGMTSAWLPSQINGTQIGLSPHIPSLPISWISRGQQNTVL